MNTTIYYPISGYVDSACITLASQTSTATVSATTGPAIVYVSAMSEDTINKAAFTLTLNNKAILSAFDSYWSASNSGDWFNLLGPNNPADVGNMIPGLPRDKNGTGYLPLKQGDVVKLTVQTQPGAGILTLMNFQ